MLNFTGAAEAIDIHSRANTIAATIKYFTGLLDSEQFGLLILWTLELRNEISNFA